MSVTFPKGYQLQASDLKIVIRNASGVPVDPYYIRFSIFDYTTGLEVLIGVPDMIPATSGVGQYYANSTIPLDANIGDWIIRWHFNETPITPLIEVVQEFTVIDTNVQTAIAQTSKQDVLVKRLRIILRDNNPDRNFRFRQPATEKFMQTQTKVFGYIWEDEELYEYLLMAVDEINSSPPVTGVTLDNIPDRWRTNILLRAGAFACGAVTMNWISDEFSISGKEYIMVKDEEGNRYTLTCEELFDILYGDKLKRIHEEVNRDFEEILKEISDENI
jgi:hypothetical protein